MRYNLRKTGNMIYEIMSKTKMRKPSNFHDIDFKACESTLKKLQTAIANAWRNQDLAIFFNI